MYPPHYLHYYTGCQHLLNSISFIHRKCFIGGNGERESIWSNMFLWHARSWHNSILETAWKKQLSQPIFMPVQRYQAEGYLVPTRRLQPWLSCKGWFTICRMSSQCIMSHPIATSCIQLQYVASNCNTLHPTAMCRWDVLRLDVMQRVAAYCEPAFTITLVSFNDLRAYIKWQK